MTFLNPLHFRVVAGQSVVDAIRADRERLVAKNELGHFASGPLTAAQEADAARGIRGAEIVKTLRGYSVRYDSGLQNFGILAAGFANVELATVFAVGWVNVDPAHRYAFIRS